MFEAAYAPEAADGDADGDAADDGASDGDAAAR